MEDLIDMANGSDLSGGVLKFNIVECQREQPLPNPSGSLGVG